jgi:integrase
MMTEDEIFNGTDDRSRLWRVAFESWLNSVSPNSRRVYLQGWRSFLETVNKLPWLIGRSDVSAWLNRMHTQEISNATIQVRLVAISSFYNYARDEFSVIGEDGLEKPLHTWNPASGKHLRPRSTNFGKATYFTRDQLILLLGSIPRTTVQGLRDYALFLAYIYTGRRNSEIRNLKWGDIEERDGTVWYHWSGKGKFNQIFELPQIVYEAIRRYLAASGRSIKPVDFIFVAVTNNSKRSLNSPISSREMLRLVKFYVDRIGLESSLYHVHSLRHSAAVLRDSLGDDIKSISHFLAHSSTVVTENYLHELKGQRDGGFDKVTRLLDLSD